MNSKLSILATSVVASAAILLTSTAVMANEKIASCEACHGAGGKEPIDASYPIIAGQYKDYLVHALEAYRNGDRTNILMASQATNLTDKDIDELAEYFSKQEGL